MALNIRKEQLNELKIIKIIKDNFYIISIEIVFFTYLDTLCPDSFYRIILILFFFFIIFRNDLRILPFFI